MQAIVSSLTPAWKNAPPKSPRTIERVFFRNPSVLSLLERSAEEHIMFGTCSAKAPRHAAEAARVAEPSFCSMTDQSTLGALPLNHSFIWAAFSGFASAQAFSSAWRPATILRSSSLRSAYSFLVSSKMTNGFSGSPPRFLIVLM